MRRRREPWSEVGRAVRLPADGRITEADASLAILVVDDEAPVREVICAFLRQEGHRTGEAANGREALARFTAGRWDLVMTDRAMPEMDGEQLALEVRKLSPQTPIIMVTGFAPAACCAGVDVIVKKPFTRASLMEALERCADVGK
jgi:CheY-like chemotaxis protein